jgi:hypothetical protein
MSRRDDFVPVAKEVALKTQNLSARSKNMQDVIDELQKQKVFDPEYTTLSLNGTLDLDNTNNTLHILTGSATGFSIELPDATTLFNGAQYIIANQSTATVFIKDSTGTQLIELLADSVSTIYLQSNNTVAGIWIGTVVSGFATGIISYNITSSVPFTTNSSSDVLITGFSITPLAGKYAAWYSSDIEIQQNNRLARCTIYKANSAIADSTRVVQGMSNNFVSAHQTLTTTSVNGSQALDVRVRVSGGNLTTNERSLLLIRLGPEEV